MDERARAAERAATQDESPEGQARVLVARMRAGTLDPRGVKLAAVCGHRAALLAFACQHDDISDGDRGCVCWYSAGPELGTGPRASWVRWIAGVYRTFGVEALLRVSILSARLAIAKVPGLGCQREHEVTNAAEAYSNAFGDEGAMRYWVSTVHPEGPGFGLFVPYPVQSPRLDSLMDRPGRRSAVLPGAPWHLDPDELRRSCLAAWERVTAAGEGRDKIVRDHVCSHLALWALAGR